MTTRMPKCLVLAQLVILAGTASMARDRIVDDPSPFGGGGLSIGATATLDVYGVCEESACYVSCNMALRNRHCWIFRAWCSGGDTCNCRPVCAVPGQNAWARSTLFPEVESTAEESCETREDTCHE